MAPHPDKNIIALGIRQPWAELILSGRKTIEVRSLNTRQRGTIYIYASKKLSEHPAAREAARKYGVDVDSLPLGVIVGTVDIIDSYACKAGDAIAACLPKSHIEGQVGWKLGNPRRFSEPLTVRFLPYGVWFYPYQRRSASPGTSPRVRSSNR